LHNYKNIIQTVLLHNILFVDHVKNVQQNNNYVHAIVVHVKY